MALGDRPFAARVFRTPAGVPTAGADHLRACRLACLEELVRGVTLELNNALQPIVASAELLRLTASAEQVPLLGRWCFRAGV